MPPAFVLSQDQTLNFASPCSQKPQDQDLAPLRLHPELTAFLMHETSSTTYPAPPPAHPFLKPHNVKEQSRHPKKRAALKRSCNQIKSTFLPGTDFAGALLTGDKSARRIVQRPLVNP
jgi:hypothetical protein